MKFLITTLALLGWTAVQGTIEKPSIILIYADDLGYGDLSCYGAKHIKTPHCDRVAKEGMRFTAAHSPSAVCSPSRSATLTGRYAWRTWMRNWVCLLYTSPRPRDRGCARVPSSA